MNSKNKIADGNDLYLGNNIEITRQVSLDKLMDDGFMVVIDANTDQLLLQLYDGEELAAELPITEESYDNYMAGAMTLDIIGSSGYSGIPSFL
jgi:hypothetical protein